MTREEQLRQLESLQECVVDIGLAGEVLPSAGAEGLPSLRVEIPTGEEGVAPREMVCTFLPVEEDRVRYTTLLQMYMELPVELPEEAAPLVMMMMHQVNQIFAVGQCFWRMDDQEGRVFSKIGVRYTLATPVDQAVDEGCFCETMLLLADAFDMLNQILEAAQTPEKGKELLYRLRDLLEDTLRQFQDKPDNTPNLEDTANPPAPQAGPQPLEDSQLDEITGGGPSGRHSRRR